MRPERSCFVREMSSEKQGQASSRPQKKPKVENDDSETAKLRRLLADKDAELRQLRADKDAELRQLRADKDAQLADKDAKLADKDAKLRQLRADKDAELRQLRADFEAVSLERLLMNCPSMDLVEQGSGKSHTAKTVHREAEMKVFPDFKMVDLSLEKNHSKVLHMSSYLLLDFQKTRKKYSTESDISNIVTSALKDAIRLAEASTGREFEVRHEMSFFSQRPDHLVVIDSASNIPLMAVEDKKPWDKSIKTSDQKAVLGQIFDYAVAMKAFGHATPFVILTTFRRSTMFWLENDRSNSIAKGVFSVETEGNATCYSKKTKTPSPPDLKDDLLESNYGGIERLEAMSGEELGFSTSGDERKLMVTKEYESKDLVPLLYTAILCGLQTNPSASVKRELQKLKPGDMFSGGALKMTAESYEWGHLRAQVGRAITLATTRAGPLLRTGNRNGADNGSIDSYYVIGIIGAGDTSKVFHALDWNGNECVIKMFTKRTVDGSELSLKKEDFENMADQKTRKEVSNFELIYPFLRGKVSSKTIYNHFCVVMPFFRPLQKAECKKDHVLKQIKKTLQKFVDAGKKYEESDLRWRHIGMYEADGEETVILFDLADLENVDGGEQEDAIEKQIKYLKERAK